MAAVAEKLTFIEFQSSYEHGDRSYIVNPESRQVFRWIGTALEVSDALTSIPAKRIWEQLDEAMHRRR